MVAVYFSEIWCDSEVQQSTLMSHPFPVKISMVYYAVWSSEDSVILCSSHQ